MDPVALTLVLVSGVALLLLPRRWAALPLIAGACYMTRGEGVSLGPFTFTIIRMLVVVGITRALVRREWPAGGLNGLDALMFAWGAWMIASVWFHTNPCVQVVNRLGVVFDGWGVYFIFRGLCRSRDEIAQLCRVVAIVLVPIAVAMFVEKLTAHNMFAVFGGVPATPEIREGSVRAQGPFAHSILAGNVGGVSLPLMVGLWFAHRRAAFFGTIACVTIVYACASSGPIMTAAIGVAALMFWRYRAYTRHARWAAVAVYLALEVVMKQPPYYLMARIDLAGGSTGWHRSRLIESAFEHFGEWWLVGTDYTRHWMPTGVSWSVDHTDITNHYLSMGVLGGVPLMLLFIAILAKGFSLIGQGLAIDSEARPHSSFMVWATGAALTAHAATCISVAYFDQSIVFLYLTLAAASAAGGRAVVTQESQVGMGAASRGPFKPIPNVRRGRPTPLAGAARRTLP